jgi:diacylglycerol kinase family enzyme
VAIGLAGSGIAMGVIPLGTANVLAGELGLPSDPEGIASMLLDGRVMALSCGRIADGPFLLMVGAGFDAAVVASVSSRIKRTFGKLAYVGPFIRALARGPQTFAATIDGVDHQCTWLVVANARNYAGRFVIARDRNLTAPGLTALAVTTRSRLGLLRVVLAIALGRTPPASLARLVPCRTATIPPGQDVPVQVDGDHLAATSIVIGPDKISLDLVVPQRVANLTCG